MPIGLLNGVNGRSCLVVSVEDLYHLIPEFFTFREHGARNSFRTLIKFLFCADVYIKKIMKHAVI